ncbi:acyl-CoA dehydrogenase family protein [Burkholderia sp. 22PA0099]|uniref:acyl-CoA dehydrogenase family protein n=1 Tax=Burkholderia sp. 22PA0099 TaxID=3237372 RepID=UPI0039C2F2B9
MTSLTSTRNTGLGDWLDAHAESLDTEPAHAAEVLPRLARAGLSAIGVPASSGGAGGNIADAIDAVAQVAGHSLAAAFVLWGHRTFVEYLLQGDCAPLRERWLPALIDGTTAGASGLSNAMKYLSAIESLQMRATRHAQGYALDGSLPWITNLRPAGFLAAAAFEHDDGAPPSIFALPHDAPGLQRSDDLDLVALRGSNTAALRLEGVVLDAAWRITADAPAFLARLRPAFLGLQCGMSLGLAQRALTAASASGDASREAIAEEIDALAAELAAQRVQLLSGVLDGRFLAQPAALFELRIALAGTVNAAVGLEVQASGGRGYLRGSGGTARRVREAAFVPIVTPSLVQLKTQLARHRQADAA